MVRQVEVRNYKCFRALDVHLASLTVLIGKNNTGKSTFLEALTNASTGVVGHAIAIDDSGFKGNGTGSVTLRGGPAPTVLQLAMPQAGPRMSSKGVKDGTSAPLGLEHTASFMDWLLRRDRTRFDQVVAAMRQAIPGLQDVSIAVPDATSRRLDVTMEGGWQVPADSLSAGARMMLFFVAMGFHPTPPELVLIEEPENGLHPGRLKEVVEILRSLTTRNPPVQVVLSTHSPYLLDLVDFEKDQVLVFQRHEDGSCTASPLARDKVEPFMDEFGLGEVWSNRGEAGLVQ